MRLRRRLQALLLAFLALVAAGLVVDLVVVAQRNEVQARVDDVLLPARRSLTKLELGLLEQETGQRGFLLTGSERFLEPYDVGRVESASALDRLRLLLGDEDEVLAASVDRLRGRVQAWQQLGAEFEIDAQRTGREEVLRALVTGGTSRRLFEAAREEVSFLRAALDLTLDEKQATSERYDTAILVVEVVSLGAIVGLVGVLGLLMGRWVMRPIEDLGRAVRSVASGALDAEVAVDGPPELTDLANDVESMRRRILAEVDDADRAREALADRGMVVLTLREELAAGRIPLPAGVQLTGRFQAATGIVAGDWFDVARLDGDRVALALVDVSGHGAGVGAFALRTKALTMAAIVNHDPGDAFAWVLSRLGDTGEQFLTGVIVVLDASTGSVRYASAGHPPMLLGGLTGVTELRSTGPLLGPVPGTWETLETTLERGGVLAAYSDGLIEARDAARRPFGVDRLSTIVESAQLEGPDAVADACLHAVGAHQVAIEDDLTICVLGR